MKKNAPNKAPSNEEIEKDPLTWDDTYTIAQELQARHPDIDLEQVSLGMIYDWTLEIPEFQDDPELANESILMSIFQEWFEEEFVL